MRSQENFLQDIDVMLKRVSNLRGRGIQVVRAKHATDRAIRALNAPAKYIT